MRRLLLLFILPALALASESGSKTYDLNNWDLVFYGDGRWGIDIVGAGHGGTWQGYPYLFGAGAWLGGVARGDTVVAVGYNPNSGGSEMNPGLVRHWREDPCPGGDDIWLFWRDWPPPPDRYPMAPRENISTRDLWCCYCDSTEEASKRRTPALGIEVYQTVYGWRHTLCMDIVFLRYQVHNPNPWPIEDMYIGLVLDPDIGSGSDDMVGLILDHTFEYLGQEYRVTNTGFAFDYDNREQWNARETIPYRDSTPGAVAVRFLKGPGGSRVSAFKKFTIDLDPISDQEQYLTLAGYDHRTGVYAPFDVDDEMGADKRFLLSTGPFDLGPRRTEEAWFAVIGSHYGDWGELPEQRDAADLSDLLLRSWFAELTFDGICEQLPEPAGFNTASLSISPNPARTGFVASAPSVGSDRQVGIYDASGRLAANGELDAWLVTQGLLPGVYLVRAGNLNAKLVVTE